MPEPRSSRPRGAGGSGDPTARPRTRRPRLHGWRHPSVVAAAGLSVAAGFAAFSVTASLADIALAFGEAGELDVEAAEAGLLSGTTVGIGLAIIRFASLGALPLAGLADEHGRRRVALACCAAGLAFTVASAVAPSYWWFVAIFALGRPMLSGTNAIAAVIAAEETTSADRSKALALISAGYAVGAGLTQGVRVVMPEEFGFRPLFALSIVWLAVLALLARRLHEPDRYAAVQGTPESVPRRPVLRSVRRDLRPRLRVLLAVTFGLGFVTGPVNTFLFFYAEGVLGMAPSTLLFVILAAGPIGLVGLLAGRWTADRFGRRITAGLALAAVATAGIVTYSGSPVAVIGGYLFSIVAASGYTPAAGALNAELFPTSIRATIAGWITAANVVGAVAGLVVFGVLADLLGAFPPAAAIVCVPVVLASALYAWLPETRGLELEDSAPEAPA